jgi:multiple sugar transport system permease protein
MNLNAGLRAKHPARPWTTRRYGLEDIITLIAYVILTIWAVLALFPIYWMVKCSFEPTQILALWPPRLLPDFERLSLRGYQLVMTRVPVGRWFLNSVLVSSVRTGGTLFFGAMAGYAFSKLRFWGREVIFWGLMSVIMIPGFITIVPLYQVVFRLGWINTYQALIIPGITGGIGSMFLIRQFLRTLPTEIIESARIDGASELAIFLQLILPLAKPGLAVLGIFSFVGNWNSFLWPLLVTTKKEMLTLPVGLALLQAGGGIGMFYPDTQQMMAGATVLGIPMVLVFLAFQRYFLKGITIGAIKG